MMGMPLREVWRPVNQWQRRAARAAIVVAVLLAVLLAGCGQDTPADAYGGTQNHIHDLLALRGVPHTVLLASHYGLFRTTDSGHTWSEVAGGAGQQMDGLMLYKLAQSPVDAHRIYLLAIPRTGRPQDAKATPGLYTSADAGQTWKLAIAASALPASTIFTIGAGSAAAGQVYAWLPTLAERGLYTSDDFGAHWRALPPLPDPRPTGLIGDPAHPGRLLLWSASSGFYISDDGGQTWQTGAGIQGGIFSVSLVGATVYANGDAGTYVSTDGGAHFILASGQYTFSVVVSCPAAPAHAYALTGTAVYATTDMGKTWTQSAATSHHPGNLTVDPTNADTVYAGFSYPIGIQVSTNGGAHWQTALP